MRVVVRVNHTALATLQQNLQQFRERLHTSVEDAIEPRTEEAIAAMQANHAADAHEIQRYINRTYNLTESTTARYEGWADNVYSFSLGSDAPYAYDIEHGTGRSRPYPFFWQEVYPLMEDLIPELETALRESIAAVSEGVR